MKQQKLRAYLITISYAEHDYIFKKGQGRLRNFVIIARFDKEAVNKLMEHLTLNMQYKEENLHVISIQKLRKTKKNAHFFTQEYYDKQEYIIKHFEEYLKERKDKQ